MFVSRLVLITLLSLVGAACGDTDPGPGETGSSAGAGGAQPAGGDSCKGTGIVVGGVVREYAVGVERQLFDGLKGATVCVVDAPDVTCATTDEAGFYGLCDVPANSDLMLSFEKEGYINALRMLVTRNEDYDLLAESVLGSVEQSVDQAEVYGFDLETITGGAIQFFAAAPGDGVLQVRLLDGYSVELLNVDGTDAECDLDGEMGPCPAVYIGEDGLLDRDATSASRIGVGAFGNVLAGDYDLVFSHPDLECDGKLPESGWATERDNAVRVRVTDQWVTSQVGMFCQPGE